MRTLAVLLCAVACGHVVAHPPADDYRPWYRWWLYHPQCPSVGCCPNDYRAKPLPCLQSVDRCGGPDDYCRKAMPAIPCLPRNGGCDDYGRKPLPPLLCPPPSPFLRCGPASPCPAR